MIPFPVQNSSVGARVDILNLEKQPEDSRANLMLSLGPIVITDDEYSSTLHEGKVSKPQRVQKSFKIGDIAERPVLEAMSYLTSKRKSPSLPNMQPYLTVNLPPLNRSQYPNIQKGQVVLGARGLTTMYLRSQK